MPSLPTVPSCVPSLQHKQWCSEHLKLSFGCLKSRFWIRAHKALVFSEAEGLMNPCQLECIIFFSLHWSASSNSLFRPKLTSVPSDTSPNSLRLSDLTCFLSPSHKKQLQIWYISYDTRKEHYKGWQSPCLSLLAFYGLLLLGWPSPMVYSFCQSFCWIQLWYTYLCLLVPWFPLKI